MKQSVCWLCGLLALTACSNNNPPTPTPTNPWVFQYSPNMTAPTPNGEGGFYFDFPSQDGVHYLIQQRSTPLSGTMTAVINVVFSGSPIFQSPDSSSLACGADTHVDLYFQRLGDDGSNEWFRWFANNRLPVTPGDHTYTAGLVPDAWGDVYAHTDPTQFAAALATPQAMGMTFGVGCFAGHGAYVTGGTARFTIQSFTVQ